ncbi:BREX protein BrxB domain-containing protein [Sorangium sp. So ce426]|uniref:BREX protein BrxB domain-containing protein n=1 Tax=unclassified Sorangium TaxID=2621164 RepID=UPI003F5C2E0E
MTQPLFQQDSLDEAVAALRRDLLAADGPQISTMRNYRFAILPYRPKDEFKLRRLMRGLTDELRAEDWGVLPISLQRLLLDRIRATGEANVAALMSREKRLHEKSPERALEYLRDKIAPHIEGPSGIAADVAKLIADFAQQNPDREGRTLVLLGRAGALYPFFRSSALLKHIDGKTRNIPVVLLYPGERKDTTALSFMGELDADRDYRPRIYP